MNRIKQNSHTAGFTIVELLIVIVVIGILAAITVLAYNGIQQRAKVVQVQADLRNIAKQMELYKVDNGVYPTESESGSFDQYAEIVKRSNLYDVTRWSGEAGTRAERGFVFCLQSNLELGYTIVAFEPMYTFLRDQGPSYVGQPLYYVSEGGALHEASIQWDDGLVTVAANMCESADANYDPAAGVVWSYNVPSHLAQ